MANNYDDKVTGTTTDTSAVIGNEPVDPVVNPNPKIVFKDKYVRRYFKKNTNQIGMPVDTTFSDVDINNSLTQSEYNQLGSGKMWRRHASDPSHDAVARYKARHVYQKYQMDNDGIYQPTTNYTLNRNYSPNYPNMGAAPKGAFTYDASGNFDPTSEEFKQSLIQSGSFSDLAKGYGFNADDFADFDIDPLMKKKESYGLGVDSLTLKTGQSLFQLKQQADQALAETGLEGSGSIDFKKKFGVEGAFQEYLIQQKQLASDLKTDIAEFWKGTEDMFYSELDENEANT
tara:strand:- start:676 stop:1536 length:861 start_codon:yes stop_codon:yes gene_type:complete